MPKVSLHTNQTGISLVEVLLAVLLFGLLVTAITGALLYGRTSTAMNGARQRANMLAEEGVEAVRNVRDASYSNLTDGTFGLTKTSNQWALSGSSDMSDIFTRRVVVSSTGTNRKVVTATVSWPQGAGTAQTSVTTELTNWRAAIAKVWSNASVVGGADVTGTIAGYKVATVGNYAYLVRNSSTGPNFIILNITTPATPTVVGTLTLTGTPTNIAVNGNYAYVTNAVDTAELQIVNVTTPSAPTLAASYNATGAGNGLGVYVLGNYAYLTRAANGGSDEFVIVNITTPTSPTRAGGYSLNVSMYEAYVNGTVAYVATGSDTQELLVINVATPSATTLGTSINLSGTTDATSIDGVGTSLVVGQGAVMNTISATSSLAPTLSGSVTLTNTVSDVTINNSASYAFAAITGSTNQFQVIATSTWTTPVFAKALTLPATGVLTGVDYNSTSDIVTGANSMTAKELAIFGPGTP